MSGTRSSVVRTSVIFTDRAYNGGVTSALLTAGNGLGIAHVWDEALESALDAALPPLNRQRPDLVLLFADASFAPNYVDLLAAATERSHAQEVVGCSASGVIAGDRELEDEPAIAALAVCLPPGSLLRVAREPDRLTLPECTGLIVLADPYTTDVMQLIADLERTYPRVPLVGGLATGAQPQVFCGQSVSGGAVIVGLGGAALIRSVVSQGCEPIGAPWTITSGERNIIRTIGNRPAYQVLVETIQQLEPTLRQRAARNLLVGLAMDEYRDEFKRGDFLIRNLMGLTMMRAQSASCSGRCRWLGCSATARSALSAEARTCTVLPRVWASSPPSQTDGERKRRRAESSQQGQHRQPGRAAQANCHPHPASIQPPRYPD